MKKLALAVLGFGLAAFSFALAETVIVPQNRIELGCKDSKFAIERLNFLLLDETYQNCTLRLPLALKERWGGRRTFYFLPRISVALFSQDKDLKNGRWTPIGSLGNLENDTLHRIVSSKNYKRAELTGSLEKPLQDWAGTGRIPKVLGVEGRMSVCVSPVYKSEQPCVTFNINARYNIYKR
jgi:hypothetical protein